MKKWRTYPAGQSVGMTWDELSAIPDLSSDPDLIASLKAGDTVRVGVARIGHRVLDVIIRSVEQAHAGVEITSEWSEFDSKSLRLERKLPAGSTWLARLPR